MWRPRLQFIEDGIADALCIAPQMGVPKPQCFDAARLQKQFALGVVLLPVRKTMLAPVQFNVQGRFLAKEIQIVSAHGMLTAEFVIIETAVAQPTPDKFFRPSLLLAELAGAVNVSHDGNLADRSEVGKLVFARPHPNLLPREKEQRAGASGFADAHPANAARG
jgi:hypothetical protein